MHRRRSDYAAWQNPFGTDPLRKIKRLEKPPSDDAA